MEPEALKALSRRPKTLSPSSRTRSHHRLVYAGLGCDRLAVFPERHRPELLLREYYCMTGWRIGWMVLPPQLVRAVERIAQNLYISAPDISQKAAPWQRLMRPVNRAYQGTATPRTAELLMEHLPKIGFEEMYPVDGAFYVYASVRRFSNDSVAFSCRMLAEAGVAADARRRFRPWARARLHPLLVRRHGSRHAGSHGGNRSFGCDSRMALNRTDITMLSC